MNWLLENPIASMYGPRFLILYGSVCAVTLAISYLLLRSSVTAPGSGSRWEAQREAGVRIRGWATLVIVGLGGYKLVVALLKGYRNVLFLIGIGAVSLLVLHAMGTSQEDRPVV